MSQTSLNIRSVFLVPGLAVSLGLVWGFLFPIPIESEEPIEPDLTRQAGNVAHLSLKQEVVTRKDRLCLGDLVEIQGVIDSDKWKILKQVEIAIAPPPGLAKEIPVSYLISRIRRVGFSSEDLIFGGASKVRVSTESTELSPAEIEFQLREYIEEQMTWTPENAMIHISGASKKLLLPAGEVTLNFTPPSRYEFVGRGTFAAEAFVDGKLAASFHPRVNIEIFEEVVVARNPIRKGEVISDRDMDYRRTNLASVRGATYTDASDVVGLIASRGIRPGQILTDGLVEPIPLVRRRDPVKIVVEGPSFEVTLSGIALEEGALGDLIRVRNTRTRKTFLAEVSADRRVKLP